MNKSLNFLAMDISYDSDSTTLTYPGDISPQLVEEGNFAPSPLEISYSQISTITQESSISKGRNKSISNKRKTSSKSVDDDLQLATKKTTRSAEISNWRECSQGM